MTRVVHVVVAGEIGGAERMLVDLACREPHAHPVALLTPNPALKRLFVDAGLRVHDGGPVREGPLPFLWRSLGPRDAAWVASVLVRERASVAHLHTFASQVVGTRAAMRAGVPVLRTEHSTRAFDDPSCWPFSRWSLRRAHASVAISEHVRARVVARAPWADGKTRVVYDGVDTTRFAPVDVERPDFRFVIAGRLEPRKGVDLAIDALALVPGAHLDVVGDGEERRALWKRARGRKVEGRVVFHGYLPDPRPVLARSSALLCSSRAEGLGISVLEAMAMARPVVAFAVGGVREVVDDGRTGLLAKEGDVEALAARMRQAMQAGTRLEEWGEAARERVVERFSVAAMREGYGVAYEDVLVKGEPDR
jgi:glycosyltransferase involved in cell wall biosynthesis